MYYRKLSTIKNDDVDEIIKEIKSVETVLKTHLTDLKNEKCMEQYSNLLLIISGLQMAEGIVARFRRP